MFVVKKLKGAFLLEVFQGLEIKKALLYDA